MPGLAHFRKLELAFLALCLRMISAQTRSAFVARENRCTLFRIMRYRANCASTSLQAGESADACEARHCMIRPPPAGTPPHSVRTSPPQADRNTNNSSRGSIGRSTIAVGAAGAAAAAGAPPLLPAPVAAAAAPPPPPPAAIALAQAAET